MEWMKRYQLNVDGDTGTTIRIVREGIVIQPHHDQNLAWRTLMGWRVMRTVADMIGRSRDVLMRIPYYTRSETVVAKFTWYQPQFSRLSDPPRERDYPTITLTSIPIQGPFPSNPYPVTYHYAPSINPTVRVSFDHMEFARLDPDWSKSGRVGKHGVCDRPVHVHLTATQLRGLGRKLGMMARQEEDTEFYQYPPLEDQSGRFRYPEDDTPYLVLPDNVDGPEEHFTYWEDLMTPP